jgi:protein phosphatase
MDPQADSWKNRLDYASISDIGLRRSNNQDNLAVMVAASPTLWQQRGDLFMVADGMGGHAAGELASKISVDTVPLVYHKLMDRDPGDAAKTAVEEANHQINNRGQASLDFRGMGTTTTTLILLPQGAMLAHVGDSRCYRLRGTRFEQLTFDHSAIWEMKAAGQLEGDMAEYAMFKNRITRSLGPNPSVQVDLEGPHAIAAGDTFLICSDGLSGQVQDDEMGMILQSMPPAEAVQALVDLANLRGGPDNITVVVAKAVGPVWARPSESTKKTRRIARGIHPGVWIAAGVLFLAGIGMLAMGNLIVGLAIALAGFALGGGGWVYRTGGPETGPQPTNSGRFGRGPYTSVTCPPSGEFVRRLAEIVRELRTAANDKDESADAPGAAVDWNRFNGFLDRAAAANQAADHAQAIRQYCLGINFVLNEMKKAGTGKKR